MDTGIGDGGEEGLNINDDELMQELERAIEEATSKPRAANLEHSPYASEMEEIDIQPTVSPPAVAEPAPKPRTPPGVPTADPGNPPEEKVGHVSSPDQRCWRCARRGHKREQCKERPVLFCLKRGKLGSFSRTCPCRNKNADRPPQAQPYRRPTGPAQHCCPRCGFQF